MTQKELLYIEDAIGHEQNIIKICNESINNLEDNKLVSFLEKEVDEHKAMIKKLTKALEECSNE